jgi:hypothetical protein
MLDGRSNIHVSPWQSGKLSPELTFWMSLYDDDRSSSSLQRSSLYYLPSRHSNPSNMTHIQDGKSPNGISSKRNIMKLQKLKTAKDTERHTGRKAFTFWQWICRYKYHVPRAVLCRMLFYAVCRFVHSQFCAFAATVVIFLPFWAHAFLCSCRLVIFRFICPSRRIIGGIETETVLPNLTL